MSLPTATLIWHCAFITLFHSADRKVNGEGYREFALVRLDGEYWETDKAARSDIIVRKRDDFKGWDDWKEKNKKGIDVEVSFTSFRTHEFGFKFMVSSAVYHLTVTADGICRAAAEGITEKPDLAVSFLSNLPLHLLEVMMRPAVCPACAVNIKRHHCIALRTEGIHRS